MKNLSHQRLLRKLLLFVLTLSTVVALSVAVPAGAEGEGGVIYLNFKNTGIEAVTPTLSGEAGYIPSETMEYDEDLGLYWCAVSADALTVRFYVDFLDDREDISTASISANRKATQEWVAFLLAVTGSCLKSLQVAGEFGMRLALAQLATERACGGGSEDTKRQGRISLN